MTKRMGFFSLWCGLIGCALAGCASLPAAADLKPAIATPQNDVLATDQIDEVKSLIQKLNGGQPVAGINASAFVHTDRLTIGPKLPAGAVTKHLESVFLLKTDGQRCFIVSEQSGQLEEASTLSCRQK